MRLGGVVPVTMPSNDRDDRSRGDGDDQHRDDRGDSSRDDRADRSHGDGYDRSRDDRSKTVLNAIIGAVATVVLSFTSFSPVLGGMVAGYLEGEHGVRIGAISGLFAAIPISLVGLAGLVAVAVGWFGLRAALLALLALPFAVALVVGLSAFGGYLGVYVREELSD